VPPRRQPATSRPWPETPPPSRRCGRSTTRDPRSLRDPLGQPRRLGGSQAQSVGSPPSLTAVHARRGRRCPMRCDRRRGLSARTMPDRSTAPGHRSRCETPRTRGPRHGSRRLRGRPEEDGTSISTGWSTPRRVGSRLPGTTESGLAPRTGGGLVAPPTTDRTALTVGAGRRLVAPPTAVRTRMAARARRGVVTLEPAHGAGHRSVPLSLRRAATLLVARVSNVVLERDAAVGSAFPAAVGGGHYAAAP
jgi:hypothetical protein